MCSLDDTIYHLLETDIDLYNELKRKAIEAQVAYDNAVKANKPLSEIKPIYVGLRNLKAQLEILKQRLGN